MQKSFKTRIKGAPTPPTTNGNQQWVPMAFPSSLLASWTTQLSNRNQANAKPGPDDRVNPNSRNLNPPGPNTSMNSRHPPEGPYMMPRATVRPPMHPPEMMGAMPPMMGGMPPTMGMIGAPAQPNYPGMTPQQLMAMQRMMRRF